MGSFHVPDPMVFRGGLFARSGSVAHPLIAEGLLAIHEPNKIRSYSGGMRFEIMSTKIAASKREEGIGHPGNHPHA